MTSHQSKHPRSKTTEKIESIIEESIEEIEESIEETKESLEKKLERITKRFERYIANAEHDHDVLMELDRKHKEVEFLNKLLARKKTWLGKLFFKAFFK